MPCVERVGSEVWLGTSDGILRYGGSPLQLVGTSLLGERVLSMAPTPFGAIASVQVFAPGGPFPFMVELDGSGSEIRRVDTAPRAFSDLAAYQGGFLGLRGDEVFRLDANYAVLGEFAPDAADTAIQRGLTYFPEQITVLDDGRVVITAAYSFAVVEADGTVDDVFFASFALAAQPTGGGPLLILTAINTLWLHDATDFGFLAFETVGPTNLQPRFSTRYTTTASSASERLCTPVANSTGAAARLRLIATDLPAGTFCIPVYGPAPTDIVLGDGRLCGSPFTPGLTRGPVAAATIEGTLRTRFDFVTPGLGVSFVAGTTWYHQVLFRDSGPSGLNGTDSVSIRFVD